MEKGNPPWHFAQINRLEKVTGPWMIAVQRAGRYRITLRQWPAVAAKPLQAVRAKVKVTGQIQETTIPPDSGEISFDWTLPTGRTTLETWLYDAKGDAGGAYFTDVEYLTSE